MYILAPNKHTLGTVHLPQNLFDNEEEAIFVMSKTLEEMNKPFEVKQEGLSQVFIGKAGNELAMVVQR